MQHFKIAFSLLCWSIILCFAHAVNQAKHKGNPISFHVPATIIRQISLSPLFAIPCNKTTAHPNFLSCHSVINSNTTEGGKKKNHLSFSTATKTVIQTYNLGHIISSRIFSATFMGDEGAKSMQGYIDSQRKEESKSVLQKCRFFPSSYLS